MLQREEEVSIGGNSNFSKGKEILGIEILEGVGAKRLRRKIGERCSEGTEQGLLGV